MKFLLCSHKCCPGDASVEVDVLLGLWRLLKTSYLVVCVGEDEAGDLAANDERHMYSWHGHQIEHLTKHEVDAC